MQNIHIHIHIHKYIDTYVSSGRPPSYAEPRLPLK
jgi:hypothetical protein